MNMAVPEITILIAGLLGFAVQLLIIFWVVRRASASNQQIRLLNTQLDMLILIAKKNGVKDEEIEQALK